MICLDSLPGCHQTITCTYDLAVAHFVSFTWKGITCNASCSSCWLLLCDLASCQSTMSSQSCLICAKMLRSTQTVTVCRCGVGYIPPRGPLKRRPDHSRRHLPVWWALLLHGYRLAPSPSCRCHATARLHFRTVAPHGVPVSGCQPCRSPHTSSAAAAPTWSFPVSTHIHTAASQVCSSSAHLGAFTWA